MRKLYFSLLTVVIFGLSSNAFSQVLWQGSETGMSLSQVEKEFPNAVLPVKIDKFAAGGEALLNIPNYKIGSNNFKVQFIFKEEKLASIRMEAIDGSASVGFDSVKKLLKTKYGEPLDSSSNSMSYTMSWLSEGTTITLTNFMNKLVINYKVDDVTEANKL